MTYDIIVIGAGINGLAFAHRFNQCHPSARIAVLERFAHPAPSEASSHGLLRMTRSVYPTVSEVKGMSCSLKEWQILESEFDTTLIHYRPMCVYGKPSELFAGYVSAVAEVANEVPDLKVEQISLSKARHLFPQFRFEKETIILEDQTAGTILANKTITLLVEHLTKAGVEFHYGTEAFEIERHIDGYRVHTHKGEYLSQKLVAASGPWSNQILTCPPQRLKPMRQTVAYVSVKGLPTGTSVGNFPTWAYIGDGENPVYYGLPSYGGQGLKVAQHVADGPASDPDSNSLTADRDAALHLIDFVRERLVVTSAELLETESCMYSVGTDERFIVDWLDDTRQAVIIGAGSGHMFKWAPFIGQIVTDMLTDGRPSSVEARSLLPYWTLI